MSDLVRCTRCAKDVRPIQEFQPSGQMLDACPTCGNVLSIAAAGPSDEPREGDAYDLTGPLAPRVASVVAARPAITLNAKALDVLTLARARLEVLDAEIAQLEAKRAERDQLRRMIAAATGRKRRAKVVPIARARTP